jgi:uncharacterized protein YjbI with pentapeptide repeats
MSKTKIRRLWYVRRGEKENVRGPFPSAVISQYLLVGRLREVDEVSLDQAEWRSISDIDELIPDVMKADLSDPVNQANLEVARRGADERYYTDSEFEGEDSRKQSSTDLSRIKARRRERVGQKLDRIENRARRQKRVLTFVALLICLGLLLSFFIYSPESGMAGIDCNAPPAAGVNWSNCNFQGAKLDGVKLNDAYIRNANMSNISLYRSNLQKADLAYTNLGMANLRLANLRGALLIGASLRGADLRGADLRDADLSYADLQGARLAGAQLGGAKFDKSIWINGALCVPGSLGKCLAADQ